MSLVTSVYMIRHAESPFFFGEERTRGLSAEGEAAADRIVELMREQPLDAVVSSPYNRAVLTVEPLARQRGLRIDTYEELVERPIKGLDYRAEWQVLEQAIERSFDDWDYALEGGESTRQAQQRAIPLFEQLLERYEGQSIAIGTHGNIMTIMMTYYDRQFDYAFWKRASKPDIYKLMFEGRRLIRTERLWSEP